eukprot:4911989-Amphidinium_carterae.1
MYIVPDFPDLGQGGFLGASCLGKVIVEEPFHTLCMRIGNFMKSSSVCLLQPEQNLLAPRARDFQELSVVRTACSLDVAQWSGHTCTVL